MEAEKIEVKVGDDVYYYPFKEVFQVARKYFDVGFFEDEINTGKLPPKFDNFKYQQKLAKYSSEYKTASKLLKKYVNLL